MPMIQPISELAGCRKAIVAGYSKGNHVYLYRRVSEEDALLMV
jgi:hypothetical protein